MSDLSHCKVRGLKQTGYGGGEMDRGTLFLFLGGIALWILGVITKEPVAFGLGMTATLFFVAFTLLELFVELFI